MQEHTQKLAKMQRLVQKYSNLLTAEICKDKPDFQAIDKATEDIQDELYEFGCDFGKFIKLEAHGK